MRDHKVDPFDDLIERPEELRRWLTERAVFRFEPYRSGLFPASDLSPEQRMTTGMGMAWFRDNAHVAMALLDDGRTTEASRAGSAMLSVLHANRAVLRGELAGFLPVRVNGDTLSNDTETRVQHDSTGYALWLVSRLIKGGHLDASEEDLRVLAETVNYLARKQYWKTPDEGHWEEDRRIHASSIGTAMAGLREARELFDACEYEIETDVNAAIQLGAECLASILNSGRTDLVNEAHGREVLGPAVPTTVTVADETRRFLDSFDVDSRQYDGALLFLVEPLGVLTEAAAATIVADVEKNLVRTHGVVRYQGDTYWEPRFPDIMGVEERTSAAEGRTEKRNLTAAGVAFTGTEAQWTLFDPILSVYWGDRYLASGDDGHRKKQLLYLRRSLSQLVPILNGDEQGLPEAYYLEYENDSDRWIANDHTPLLWSHANLLRAVRALERTSQ